MRTAVTGSSGLIGSALVDRLRQEGQDVLRLVRREPREPDEVFWNPAGSRIDAAALEGLDAAVHLGGENIGAGRWTEKRKKKLRDSRIPATGLLARTLAGLRRPPAVLVSASGVGYYGDRGANLLRELDPPGKGFLPELARDWEAAADPAEAGGIRTVKLRTGMVLSPKGGALQRMLPPFRLGLGGPIGGGHQYMSWIVLEDLIRVIRHVIENGTLAGPINATSPNPVTNLDFTRILARVLSRPAIVPLPAFAARAALGEMADHLLLASQRAVPIRLVASGFEFLYPELEPALRHLLA